jgi:putative nucleotidyltransferase with HDIG domain
MTTAWLDQIVERVGSLPRLPDTVVRLVSVVSDPTSTLPEIVETIQYDPTLTAELLRLCNSAYYGLARQVESLDDAVRMLGTAKIFQLSMAAHTRTMLSGPQKGYGLPAGAMWSHAVATAVAAQLLARRAGLAQPGLLFTAGLLHDVGKMVLNEYVQQEYAEIVRRVTEERLTFSEVEQEVLGCTHADVGARLAEAWNLPDILVDCIRYHHDPDVRAVADARVDVVHLADAVCILFGLGTGDDGLCYRPSAAALGRLGLEQTELEAMGADIIDEVRTVRALFVR